MRTRFFIVAVTGSLAFVGCTSSSPGTANRYAPSIEESRRVVTGLLQQYPGLNVAVAVDGRIVWSEGAGFADLSSSTRATPSTKFRTYSSTKWLTAALAARLADQKRVDLDAPISKYLRDLPPATGALTLRQLLLHRGGIRHYREGEWLTVSNRRCTRATDALADFIDDQLVAAPGTSYTYSSFGYVLASAVLEAATNQSFHDLLEREIFRPAGMRSTAVESEVPGARDASPYQKVEREFRPAPFADTSCKFGAGGLMSTAEDLARFGVALSEGRLLSQGRLAEMMKGEPTVPGRPLYGLGVVIEDDEQLGKLASRSGGALGGRSFLLAVPGRRIVVALAANFEGPPLQKAAVDLAKAFARGQV